MCNNVIWQSYPTEDHNITNGTAVRSCGVRLSSSDVKARAKSLGVSPNDIRDRRQAALGHTKTGNRILADVKT